MTRDDVALQDFNSLRVPAMADHFAELTTPSEVNELLAHARSNRWPITVLGEGSNVVLADRIPGLVILQRTRGVTVLEEDEDRARVMAAAGENWHDFVCWCLERGLYGLENLALIPGTVGAAPIQNVGAYGVEVGSFITLVTGRLLPSGEIVELDREACQFGYRNSIFKGELANGMLIESVIFDLPKTAAPVANYPSLADYLSRHEIVAPTPEDVFAAVVAIRRARLPDPAQVPNAGSFFKNPLLSDVELETLLEAHPDAPHYDDAKGHKVPAAWLIEQCGFKQRDGAVRVHADHALVIINPRQRPARDIAALAREIVAEVQSRFGILLEQEPRHYGVFEP